MSVRIDYFTTAVSQEFFDAFAGEQIGEGVARRVFECRFDRSLVIKIEVAARSFQNFTEWKVWNEAKGPGHTAAIARWLAPCVDISPCGVVLIQKRAVDVVMADLPRRVPAILKDLKVSNWGRIGTQIVCRDYGHCDAIANGLKSKLHKADWWE